MNTTIIYIVWIGLSFVIGISDMIAVSELWKVRNQEGAAYEFLYRGSNGIYKLIFSILLGLTVLVDTHAEELLIVSIWAIIFFINALFSIMFALYIKGVIGESFVRRFIK